MIKAGVLFRTLDLPCVKMADGNHHDGSNIAVPVPVRSDWQAGERFSAQSSAKIKICLIDKQRGGASMPTEFYSVIEFNGY